MSETLGQKAQIVAAGRSEQLLNIQALRFVAAFAVVVLHCSFYTAERLDPSLGIYALGASGVRLFFVISGFVMVASSHRLEGTPHGWRVFALKRVVRIVPMYWAITTVKLAMLLAVPAVVLHSHIDWPYIVKSYLFIPSLNKDGELHPLLGVGWTLNFEMFFYLLFTLALALKIAPLRLIAPVLVALSALSLVRTPGWPAPLQFWADPMVLDFLAGMLLAIALRRGIRVPQAAAWFCLLGGLAYLLLPLPRPAPYGTFLFSFACTIAATMAIAGAIELEEKIAGMLPKWVLFMGSVSYALYLIHPILAPVAPTLMKHFGLYLPVLAIAITIAIAIVGGIVAYMLVEQPLTRRMNDALRKRHLYAAVPPSPPAAVPSHATGGPD
ncbi:MAG TPA: acyltransferase [Sphingobium sp.]